MRESVPPRNRASPSASSMVQPSMTPQQQNYQYQQMPENADFNSFDFQNAFNTDQVFTDPSPPVANNFPSGLTPHQPSTHNSGNSAPPSTDLVRRARTQPLTQQNGPQEQRNGAYGNITEQADEDEQDLEMRIAMAQRDGQGRKKQIPPFVQKLWSFLDDNNHQLIRWSDDGRSFIVLDEDEFARTLIPELFKHNNYASFVRQLNMYGFHKTVNITDGSLRQSEKARKGVKPPSMYSHPYFRKGRFDLLWLIQKPTGKSNGKRKRDGNIKEGFDSDEERHFSPGPDVRPQGDLGTAGGHQELAAIPRNELAAVRQEIKKLQQQQGIISRMIGQLKEQNDQFYRQATAFQALHDRHENSINAILTFLATFYNRSLEGHAGQHLVNMFSNAGNQNNQQHGSVVEEYNDHQPENSSQVQRYVRKPQLLLTGPNATSSPYLRPDSAVTEPSSVRPSVTPPQDAPTPRDGMERQSAPAQAVPDRATGHNTASPVTKTDAPTPDLLNQVPEDDPMLSILQNATTASTPNASAPAFDINNAFDQFAKNPSALTNQERDNFMALMNGQSGGDSSNQNAIIPHTPQPDYQQFYAQNQRRMSDLYQMQKRNGESIDALQSKLSEYSPNGALSGFDPETTDGPPPELNIFGDPDAQQLYYDDGMQQLGDNADIEWMQNMNNGNDIIDQFYEQNGTGAADTGADMFPSAEDDGIGVDHLAPQTAPGTVESLSSEATSPAGTAMPTTEEGDVEIEPGTPNKRQRRV